jgi:hypothetical protein
METAIVPYSAGTLVQRSAGMHLDMIGRVDTSPHALNVPTFPLSANRGFTGTISAESVVTSAGSPSFAAGGFFGSGTSANFVAQPVLSRANATGSTGTISASVTVSLPDLTTLVTTTIAWLNEFRPKNAYANAANIFDAIQSLYLSHNKPRDRQIAERVTVLHRDTIAEDQYILVASLSQFTSFFCIHPKLGLPKITLTPDGTIRTRWIHGNGNFVAIEFTGEPNVKLVAEIPRAEGLTATHFDSEPLANVVAIAQGMGASFE